jgi:hypothetical protein
MPVPTHKIPRGPCVPVPCRNTSTQEGAKLVAWSVFYKLLHLIVFTKWMTPVGAWGCIMARKATWH